MVKRLAVARFWFEGNAFSPVRTTLESFRQREWASGTEALERARGAETELAAVAEFAASRADWKVVVLRCASANPGGPIEEPAFQSILEEIVAGISEDRWDGVYLSLHGAAITEERAAPDLDLVRAVRDAARGAPVAASFDLHGNMNAGLAELLDFASAYRTYPHVDMRQTAARVLLRLDAIASGKSRLCGSIVRTGMLLPSFNMRTAAGPMAEILAEAEAATSGPVIDVSVFGGFPYADTRECGASAMAYAEGDRAAAWSAAARTAEAMIVRRNAFRVAMPGPNQALREAMRVSSGLVAVTDSADNPLSGGTGDTPGLFRALLDLRPDGKVVYAFFTDPEAVERCIQAGIGSLLDLELGARTSRDFGAKVPVRARVLRVTDGRFRNRGPMEFGLTVDLGNSTVVEVSGIELILTSRCQPANDPAYFDLHGIDLASTRLLCVKAKNHFRAAFEPLCAKIVDCDSPGPAAADLGSLPFRNLRVR